MEGVRVFEWVMFWIFEQRTVADDVQSGGFGDAEDKALLKRFRLFGPSGIIFFDKSGREIEHLRVVGYQPAEQFAKTLDRAASF